MRHFIVSDLSGRDFIVTGHDIEDAVHRAGYTMAGIACWQLLADYADYSGDEE